MGANTAFTATELVHVPPRRVWDLLTDWVAAPAWMPGVREMHAEGPTALGLTIDFHSNGHDRAATVTELDPGRSITITSSQGDVRADYRYVLEPDGGDTRLTLTAEVAVSDALAGLAAGIRESVAAADAQQVARFKRFAENAP